MNFMFSSYFFIISLFFFSARLSMLLLSLFSTSSKGGKLKTQTPRFKEMGWYKKEIVLSR